MLTPPQIKAISIMQKHLSAMDKELEEEVTENIYLGSCKVYEDSNVLGSLYDELGINEYWFDYKPEE